MPQLIGVHHQLPKLLVFGVKILSSFALQVTSPTSFSFKHLINISAYSGLIVSSESIMDINSPLACSKPVKIDAN